MSGSTEEQEQLLRDIIRGRVQTDEICRFCEQVIGYEEPFITEPGGGFVHINCWLHDPDEDQNGDEVA